MKTHQDTCVYESDYNVYNRHQCRPQRMLKIIIIKSTHFRILSRSLKKKQYISPKLSVSIVKAVIGVMINIMAKQ